MSTNDQMLSAQEMLDGFIRRDNAALDDYNNFPCLEGKVAFMDGRLADVSAICIKLLKKEIEREKLEKP